MDVRAFTGGFLEAPVDTIVVGVFEGDRGLSNVAVVVDKAMDGAISRMVKAGETTGKQGDCIVLHTLGKLTASRVVVVGLGKAEELSLERLRRVAGETGRFLRRVKTRKAVVEALGTGVKGISFESAGQALAEGFIMGLYAFHKYLTKEPDDVAIEELLVSETDSARAVEIERGCRFGRVLADAVNSTRDMVNEPANRMTPSDMADIARTLARGHRLECTVLEREQMSSLGMGALLGVAQGSSQPPKFIVLGYRGAPDSSKVMGWLGKAVTFDSGGISLKQSDGMESMKGDMSGGSAVMNAVAVLAQMALKANVTAIVPATENMPGGRAQRPGDVVKAMNGKTIEVVNTDAEGRLILADALCYAVKEKLSTLVDLATLTGACHIALGDFCSGLFGNDEPWQKKVREAGEASGECLWPMPMFNDYAEQIKSTVADMKNSGGRWGGAITAAKFLAEFAGNTPWAHIDIAGTAQTDKERGYLVKGATGVGVRTLVNLARLTAREE
ncbi:MAG: leucyl aminopeptidase [Chloroflexota bacterium]